MVATWRRLESHKYSIFVSCRLPWSFFSQTGCPSVDMLLFHSQQSLLPSTLSLLCTVTVVDFTHPINCKMFACVVTSNEENVILKLV